MGENLELWDWNLQTSNIEDKPKMKGTWDKQIDYETTYKKLKSELKKLRNKEILYKNDLKKYAYLIIFLTQLRNGCRIWEAIVALIIITLNLDSIDWNKRVVIKVRTQKRKDFELREVVLPKCITREDIEKVRQAYLDIKKEVDEQLTLEEKLAVKKKIVKRLGEWLRKNYGINSHSFRYAYITYLGKVGIPSQVLAKITKHKNINYLETYTQSKLAREILENFGDVDD
jgi:hypothetical protein